MLSPRFNEALEYAAWLHQGQFRKGTEIPYITHPVAVSMIAIQYGATEDERSQHFSMTPLRTKAERDRPKLRFWKSLEPRY